MKKLFNLVLVLTFIFITIGSIFQTVDASAGDNNKTAVIENLIDNGGFDTDISNWNIYNGTALTWDSGTENAKMTLAVGVNSPRYYQTFEAVLGHDYYVAFDMLINDVGVYSAHYAVIGDAISGGIVDAETFSGLSTSFQRFSTILIPTSTGTWYLKPFIDLNGTQIITDYSLLDNVMLFDLTAIFGSGNEPTLSEFEIILADAPDYFDEWNYNYYEEDSSIGEFTCERTVDNLIVNGDFNNTHIEYETTRNLFNINDVNVSTYLDFNKIDDDSFSVIYNLGAKDYITPFMDIAFTPLTLYTFSGYIHESNDIALAVVFTVYYTDGTNTITAFPTDVSTYFEFTSDPAKSMDRIVFNAFGEVPNMFYMSNLQIEEGATATDYIAYELPYDAPDNWLYGMVEPHSEVIEGRLKLRNDDAVTDLYTILYQTYIYEENHIYYGYYEIETNSTYSDVDIALRYNGVPYSTIYNDVNIDRNTIYYSSFTHEFEVNIGMRFDIQLEYTNYIYADNIMMFDLTGIYGLGNEPTIEEWEIILDANTVDGYTDGFTYDDTCYMTVDQLNPVYQYYDYLMTNYHAEANLVLTETIRGVYDIDPSLYIAKYDLDMNYIGDFYEGYIITSSLNVDGYTEHTVDYILPSPVTNEDGYIYIAYDKKGDGAKIYGSGYVFASTGDKFSNESSYIEVNGFVYSEFDNYLILRNEYEDYKFIEDNFLITHYQYYNDVNDYNVTYFSENTLQTKIVALNDLYTNTSDMSIVHGEPVEVTNEVLEGYFYASEGNILPPLFNFLNSSILYSDYLIGVLDLYISDYTNFFIDEGYANNNGFYTFSLIRISDEYTMRRGGTPIFYMDEMPTMAIYRDEVRLGTNVTVDITKPFNYLNTVYDNDYLYDNNTAFFDYSVNDDIQQRIYLETFEGLTPDDATVYYYLTNDGEDYRNGEVNSGYDFFMTDNYTITYPVPIDEKIDNVLELAKLSSPLGNIIFSIVMIAIFTILAFKVTKNIIVVFIFVFMLIALFTVLGFIPLWIVLSIVMLLFGGLFIKSKSGGVE